MDGELFTTADLDPELIEKERNQIERERKANVIRISYIYQKTTN